LASELLEKAATVALSECGREEDRGFTDGNENQLANKARTGIALGRFNAGVAHKPSGGAAEAR